MWTTHHSNFGNVIHAKYKNPESDIHQVEIYHNPRNGQWMAQVLVSTSLYRQALEEELLAAGIPPNTMSLQATSQTCSFSSNNMGAIANFIKIIKLKIPDFQAIEADITQRLRVDLNQNYITPRWTVSNLLTGTNDLINYRIANLDVVINKIALDKHSGRTDWTIQAYADTPEHKQAFQAAITASGFPQNWIRIYDREPGQPFTLLFGNTATMANFLKIIKSSTQHFEDIEAEIYQKLNIDLNQEYPMPVVEPAPRRTTTSLMVEQTITPSSAQPNGALSDANLRVLQQSIRPRVPVQPVDPRIPTLDRHGVNFNRTGFGFVVPPMRDDFLFVHANDVVNPTPHLVPFPYFFGGTRVLIGDQPLAQPQSSTSVTSGKNAERMENIINEDNKMTILGPYAIKTAKSDYAWIRLIVNEKANLLGYEEATDFTNNHWSSMRQADHLPTKFSVYDTSPDTSLHQFCVALKKEGEQFNLVRFPFRKDSKSGNHLPLSNGEMFKTISSGTSSDEVPTQGWALDFNEKAKTKGITSDDYWQPEESELETLNQAYKTWRISVEPKWHKGATCTELDFKKDDLSSNKLVIESKLTPFQRAQVEGMLFHEWNPLKTESKSSEEYCMALSLIMTGSLSDHVMKELNFSPETQSNAPVLRQDLLPSTIDKLGSRFYEGDNRQANEKSTIADVHQYMIHLMQQEINQYNPSLQVRVDTQIPNVQIGKLSSNTFVSNPARQFRNEINRRRPRIETFDTPILEFGNHRWNRGAPLLATQDDIQAAINAGNGLFTAADIAGIGRNVAYAIEQPACISAIREGLVTVADLVGCREASVIYELQSSVCLAAIREGLFTAADILRCSSSGLAGNINKPQCLAALRENRTTIGELLNMTGDELSHANRTGVYPNAPRLSR